MAAAGRNVEEIVQEAVGAEKTPGKVAQKTRAAPASPGVQTAGIAAGLGQFRRQ